MARSGTSRTARSPSSATAAKAGRSLSSTSRSGHGADLERAKEVLLETVTGLQQDAAWRNRIMPDEPIVGVESITPTAVTIRIRLHTVHEQQVSVAREIRVRAMKALENAEVPTPYQGMPPDDPEQAGPTT